jgi:type IV pilus assembly protein PilF
MKRIVGTVIIILATYLAGCQATTPAKSYDDLGVEAKEGPETQAELNVKLGVAYMQRGNNELALIKLRKALALDPNLPSAHYAIALLYDRLKKTDLARGHYHRAVEINPLYSIAQNAYGVFLCRQQEYNEADNHFMEAAKNPLYKTPQVAYANAGYCARKNGKMVLAEEYLRKALKISPRYPNALLQMAHVQYETKQYLKARAYLQRFHDVSKHTPDSLFLGIKVENELNNKNAVASYELLLKSKFPDSDEAAQLDKAN